MGVGGHVKGEKRVERKEIKRQRPRPLQRKMQIETERSTAEAREAENSREEKQQMPGARHRI